MANNYKSEEVEWHKFESRAVQIADFVWDLVVITPHKVIHSIRTKIIGKPSHEGVLRHFAQTHKEWVIETEEIKPCFALVKYQPN